MTRFFAGFGLALLAGCDVPKLWSESDIREIAREEARDAVFYEDNSEEVERLTRRVDELESELDSHELFNH